MRIIIIQYYAIPTGCADAVADKSTCGKAASVNATPFDGASVTCQGTCGQAAAAGARVISFSADRGCLESRRLRVTWRRLQLRSG